jgi:diamine N-acetyltransferase
VASDVYLSEVGPDEREACEALVLGPGQDAYVLSAKEYITRCARQDDPWTPQAITADGTVVGFVMTATDPDDGYFCVGGLIIDESMQGRGYGRATMTNLIELARTQGYTGVGLTYHPENRAAVALYRDLGFAETGETDGDELVAVLPFTTSR